MYTNGNLLNHVYTPVFPLSSLTNTKVNSDCKARYTGSLSFVFVCFGKQLQNNKSDKLNSFRLPRSSQEGWVVRVPVLRVDCEIYPPRKVFLSLPYFLQQILSKSWTSIFQTRFFACFRRFARLTCLEPNPAVFQRRDPIDFPRCALKKGCAQFQHLIVSAFTWRFKIFVFGEHFQKEERRF